MNKILHIEKLRGISVLLVVLYHLGIPGFNNGYLGVDIFFVISGFLMALLYSEISTSHEVKDFFNRRLTRLLPAYYVTILGTLTASVFIVLNHEFSQIYEQATWAAFLLSNVGFWGKSEYFAHIHFQPFLNLWSLGVEFQFYLLFPFIVYLYRRYPRLLLILSISSFIEFALLSYLSPKTAFFMIPSRIWEFMAGFYIAQYCTGNTTTLENQKPKIGLLSLVGILALLILAPQLNEQLNFPATVLVVALSALIIKHGFQTDEKTGTLSKTLLTLGKYSYAIYLVHFPIIILANYTPFSGLDISFQGATKTLLIILLTALVSYLLHHAVELRFHKKLRFRTTAISMLAFSAILILATTPAYKSSKQLTDPKYRVISSALVDRDKQRCSTLAWLQALFSNSCAVIPVTGTTKHRYLLAGDSRAGSIKSTLANTLAQHGHALRIMKRRQLPSSNDSKVTTSIFHEAVQHNIDFIVLHSRIDGGDLQGLKTLLSQSQQHNISVVYIDPIPTYLESIPKQLYLKTVGDKHVSTPTKTRADHRASHQALFSKLNIIATKHQNLIRYNSDKYFCNPDCQVISNEGIPYYYDTDHLTHRGARQLSPLFDATANLK